LKLDFEQNMEQRRTAELDNIKAKNPKTMQMAAIAVAVVGVILLLFATPVGILALVGAGFCFIRSQKSVKETSQNIDSINADYDARITAGKQKIDASLEEWNRARDIVQTFESEQIHDIVA
jgi:hypothetical protein